MTFEKIPKPEKKPETKPTAGQEQSLGHVLELARKRRKQERVKLTPDEDKRLFLILTKAIKAEKAGDLAKAIEYYTDYKNELLKIKEKKEQEEKGQNELKDKLIDWARTFQFSIAQKWIEENFDLSHPGEIVCKKSLNFAETLMSSLPENLTIKGDLYLGNSRIKELPKALYVNGECYMVETDIQNLPDDLVVVGTLIIDENAPKSLLDKAQELHAEGQVVELKKVKRLMMR